MPDHASRRVARHLGVSLFFGLGLAGAVLTEGRCVAQTPARSDQVRDTTSQPGRSQTPTWSGRLTVRPREIAAGTITMQPGEYWLDSLPFPRAGAKSAYPVYVPQQCAGPRRCPLLIWLPGQGGGTPAWVQPIADKHGIVVSYPKPVDDDWSKLGEHDRQNLNAALQQLVRKFPVDPDKIALLGRCSGGPGAAFWGGDNLDVFSRVLIVSGAGTNAEKYPITATVDPPNHTTEFFLDGGIWEAPYHTIRAAQELRQAGHPVKLVLGLRDHEHQAEDYDFIGQWLQTSWGKPVAARPAAEVVADSLPLLTTEALRQLTAFWTRFMQAPDSIRITARQAHMREVGVPLGEDRPSVVMVNMPALTAHYPSVAAALKEAGLTAQQHDAYRAALVSAIVAKSMTVDITAALARPGMADQKALYSVPAVVLQPNSVQSKNVAFLAEHPDELAALDATGMLHTP